MRCTRSLLLVLVVGTILGELIQGMPEVPQVKDSPDKITNLPGLTSPISFNQYAGYLNVDPVNNRNIFYWFVESQNSPQTDPVVLWTNGGPGCSGLIGFFTEHGPFAPESDGKTLMLNPNSWNQIANMLYIECPAGVGFSYSDNPQDYTTGDNKTAADNYKAIQAFLIKYPQYLLSDFYISSESYGGHYMPTLALAIVNGNQAGGNPQINFKGFLVGNPYTDPVSNDVYGTYATFYGHSLISKPVWDQIQAHCLPNRDPDCGVFEGIGNAQIGNLDPYALDFPVCLQGGAQRRTLLEYIRSPLVKPRDQVKYPYDPCRDNYATQYLNRPEVIAAIHANPNLGRPWTECNTLQPLNYSVSDQNVYMEPIYVELLARANLKILVYSGDDDSVCATTGSQYWLYNMNLTVTQDWKSWTYNGQVAGYVVKFKGLSFVTVHGAGHEVPTYKPEQAFVLFQGYLNGTWF